MLLKSFRVISILEGVSYLLLLGIAVPWKYILGNEIGVKILGMPHGILFMTYIVMAYVIKDSQNWNYKVFSLVLLASILPFGTFYIDKKYLRK